MGDHDEALRFLVRVGDALDEAVGLQATLSSLAHLTVPLLADGCMVDMRRSDGSIERVASAAADSTLEPILEELQRHTIDPEGPDPIARAMRSGRTDVVADISGTFRREIAASDNHYMALQRWPARSLVVAPMRSHGNVLGTLALASFSGRAWGSEEVSLIEELARRAATAIENARLGEERALLAQTLRESLLPPRIPDVSGAEIAARFQPAAATGEVSGDFYDVFCVDDFDWGIAIGDVSGRGVEAAATTALARHTIRAVATYGARPAATLAVLNDALLSQAPEVKLCTAVAGLLAIGSAGARLSIANGGHPSPLHLHADGRVEPIVGSGTALGVVREPTLGEAEVDLAVGDSVIFYTDGLTGGRANGQRGTYEELVGVVESCVDLGAATTAASIDQALLDRNRTELRDDAAILVLRILESEDAPSREPVRTGERERWLRTRRLAWSRLAGRGGAPDQPPSHPGERSDPR